MKKGLVIGLIILILVIAVALIVRFYTTVRYTVAPPNYHPLEISLGQYFDENGNPLGECMVWKEYIPDKYSNSYIEYSEFRDANRNILGKCELSRGGFLDETTEVKIICDNTSLIKVLEGQAPSPKYECILTYE